MAKTIISLHWLFGTTEPKISKETTISFTQFMQYERNFKKLQLFEEKNSKL